MMQHKFDDISKHVSLKGMLKLDRIAEEAAQIARERESASRWLAKNTADSCWMVVQVAFGHEQAVERAMLEADIEACVPMRMGPERKRHGKRLPAQSMPVFNGVVFVFCLNIGEALRGVLGFKHVNRIIMNGERAVPIDAEVINSFKVMAENGDYDWERSSSAFYKGQTVRITSGPFVGYEVRIDAFAGAGNGDAVVTILIFGKPTVFNMPLVMLEKV
jgi:transcriptional antiterminator NusG